MPFYLQVFNIVDSIAKEYHTSPFDILKTSYNDFIRLLSYKIELKEIESKKYTADGKIRRKAQGWL